MGVMVVDDKYSRLRYPELYTSRAHRGSEATLGGPKRTLVKATFRVVWRANSGGMCQLSFNVYMLAYSLID